MRLRSLTKNVKDQNWFAVALDFFIVVAGILIAFQITEWNEARKVKGEAEVFTARLISDLKEEAFIYEYVVQYYSDALNNARRAVNALEGTSGLSDEALVIAAFRATQYTLVPRRRETFDELTSTGRLNLIDNQTLRETATRIYDFPLYQTLSERGESNMYRKHFRMHIPSRVHNAVNVACGDRAFKVLDYKSIIDILDYPCSPDVTAAQLKSAADVLRNDEMFLPTLRLRLAELDTAKASLTLSFGGIHDSLTKYRTKD